MPRAWSGGFTCRCISSATTETSFNLKMLASCLHFKLFATVAASCQVLRAGNMVRTQIWVSSSLPACARNSEHAVQQMKPTRTMINFSDLMVG